MTTTLKSPGTQLTVNDNTAYTSSTTGTVPFILVATAQDKTNQSNSSAVYTTSANSGKLWLETSQRSLVADFGEPNFLVSDGTPVNGSELNEYGLMTAYETLGIGDEAYIMRADIDLDSLSGSATAPVSAPANATVWFDTAATSFGLLQWNSASQSFVTISTTNASGSGKLWIISSAAQTDGTTSGTYGANYKPASTIGKIGDYAVVTVNANNLVWYMGYQGTWNIVGSAAWQSSIPAVVGTSTVTGTVTGYININSANVAFTSATLATIISDINSANIAGVSAYASGNRLALTANSTAANYAIVVSAVSPSTLGITAATYHAPAFSAGSFTNVPAWTATDSYPAPTGSIWYNTSSVNNGANIVVETYNSTSATWKVNTVTVAANDAAAIYALDAIGGGANIATGTLYAETGVFSGIASTTLLQWTAGAASITGTIANATLASGTNTFTINAAVPGSGSFQGNVIVSFNGTSVNSLVSAVNSLGINGLTASVSSTGYVTIENTFGSTFYLYDGTGSPLTTIGMNLSSIYNKVSNWSALTYVQGSSAPTADASAGTLWYYDDPTAADILINTGSTWASYATVTADVRGYNLTLTDPNGPIASASTPTTQSDGTALVAGDLWLNTSDLTSLPAIYRYNGSAWGAIDTADHVTSNGIVFADARWSAYGNVDAGLGTLTPISTLITITPAVLDSDAPSYALYPRGTLLFNTRRSGMNVKKFTDGAISGSYPNTWVSASGNDESGIAYLGSAAQRRMVVKAMISALENSEQLQDEYHSFNLMCAPGYPELLPTLKTINEDRNQSALIISDAPMTLAPDASALAAWAGNTSDAASDGVDGLVTRYQYAAVYYPAGLTQDLSGNDIVVPASHMALNTIIKSDAASYPWIAPAGTTRGLVSVCSSIGYIDAATGDYITNSVSKNLRDTLYPLGVNPITNMTDTGVTIYGQKTTYTGSTELNRINVARLTIYLRQKLQDIAKGYVFEQNDATTRKNFKYKVEKFLANMITLRGISDYAVVCDETNNTTAIIDANELYCDVAVVPITSAEFIYINLNLDATI